MIAQTVLELVQPVEEKRLLNAVLAIAGSDSSGGAGVEADIKTITAHKVYALTCITALTAQNTMGVEAVVETPTHHLRKILEANVVDFAEGYKDFNPLKVVKTGMLTNGAVEVLADYLDYFKERNIKMVVDPVMIATSGTSLVKDETVHLLLEKVIPSTYLCTPNFDEAIFLWQALGGKEDTLNFETMNEFTAFVADLQKLLRCENLLVKGGHVPFVNGKRISGDVPAEEQSVEIYDILFESKSKTATVFKAPYIATKNSHGTGCTLASAISANLANRKLLTEAVALSIHYVHKGMVSIQGQLGHGNGPLNHTVDTPKSFMGVIHGSTWSANKDHATVYDYFKNHPSIKESWERYTRHPFLELVATNQLPFDDFLYYLKQDFYYLVHYAKVHGHAISVAPDCAQIESQTRIIANIMEEIERHKLKLASKYNIDYDNSDLDSELQPGPACIAYCDYLAKVGREQDFLAIKVAVAPCLHGYAEAGLYGLSLRKQFNGELNKLENQEQSDVYSAWLDDYGSEWYRSAHEEGIQVMSLLFEKERLSEPRKKELCEMFHHVVKLEIAFWDEVVDRSKHRSR